MSDAQRHGITQYYVMLFAGTKVAPSAIPNESTTRVLMNSITTYCSKPQDNLVAGLGKSKSFAMAGLRIGWLATRDRELLARCAALKDYTTICSSAPAEILSIIGIRARAVVLARSRRIVEANLVVLDRLFAERADRLTWVRPRGGSIGFARLLDDESVDDFAARLVETEGVLLLPGSRFGFEGNHFRIGFGREDLPAAVAGLERFLDQ